MDRVVVDAGTSIYGGRMEALEAALGVRRQAFLSPPDVSRLLAPRG
jgi:hypothetical protein